MIVKHELFDFTMQNTLGIAEQLTPNAMSFGAVLL